MTTRVLLALIERVEEQGDKFTWGEVAQEVRKQIHEVEKRK